MKPRFVLIGLKANKQTNEMRRGWLLEARTAQSPGSSHSQTTEPPSPEFLSSEESSKILDEGPIFSFESKSKENK